MHAISPRQCARKIWQSSTLIVVARRHSWARLERNPVHDISISASQGFLSRLSKLERHFFNYDYTQGRQFSAQPAKEKIQKTKEKSQHFFVSFSTGPRQGEKEDEKIERKKREKKGRKKQWIPYYFSTLLAFGLCSANNFLMLVSQSLIDIHTRLCKNLVP